MELWLQIYQSLNSTTLKCSLKAFLFHTVLPQYCYILSLISFEVETVPWVTTQLDVLVVIVKRLLFNVLVHTGKLFVPQFDIFGRKVECHAFDEAL